MSLAADSAEAGTGMVRSRAGEHGEVMQMSAPRPGSYWRVRTDIEGQHDHRRKTNALAKDTILLLRQVEAADGEVLVYIFAPHPSLPKSLQIDSRFHADDFYTCFEPAPDGEQLRQTEIAQLLLEMEHVKHAMLAPPPDAAPAGLLAHDPVAQVGTAGQSLATTEQINAMVLHAERIKEEAERRANWIAVNSKKLGSQAVVLANFHQERAAAALARANEQLEGVSALLRTADNLRLYTGEGVSVLPLRDGAPAEAAEPITIYQDVLSFDEETLILLDQGGADHTKVAAIARALADPLLLDRLIPAQRGMTLVRFRASFKEFVSVSRPDDIAAHAYNAAMSRESQRLRLLVRDGERLSLLDIAEVLQGIKQLMPSAGEQDAYFLDDDYRRGEQGPRRVTREHLDFAQRRRDQVGALDAYGKVLIALWGLYDRGELFQEGPMPRFSNWLDPEVQNRYLRLVSLDAMLSESRPSYAQWRDAQNRYLSPGATVAVHLSGLITPTHLPAAFSNSCYRKPTQVYKLDLQDQASSCIIGRVASDGTGLYLPVPLRYDGYRTQVQRVTITGKLYLQFHGARLDSSRILVLDRAHAPDLAYYLQSRTQRRAYSEYVQLFQAARAAVAERDRIEAPLREALRQALLEGRIPHDPERVEGHFTDAIAVARASRRTNDIPCAGSLAFKSFLTAALNALHAAATGDAQKIAAIEAWAAANGRQPLRLAFTGRQGYRLFLVPLDQEHDPRMGPALHASVADVTFGEDGGVTLGPIMRELLRARAGELVLRDWEWEIERDLSQHSSYVRERMARTEPAGASKWALHNPRYRLPYASVVETLDMGVLQSRVFKEGIDPDVLAEEAMTYSRAHSKRGMVERMSLRFAIGTSLDCGSNDTPMVLVASIDAWHYAYAHGTESTRQTVRSMIQRRYMHPESSLARLDAEPKWLVSQACVDDVSKFRTDVRIGHGCRRSRIDQDDVERKSGCKPRVRVTSITAAGASLFPWLLAVAERPLE